MSQLEFTALVALGSMTAGFLGALTGLGGGVVIVPMLTLLFGVDLKYAIGASIVSVIATSSGAAAAYVREGYSNVRIGMFLEIATTLGAVAGVYVALIVSPASVAVIFGAVLLFSAYLSFKRPEETADDAPPDPIARALRLDSSYPTPEGPKSYHVRHIPFGFVLMFCAGVLSGLLGVGSGALKVLAMDQVMRLPFKVSTTTSNFMIGVTAAASAGIYLSLGYIKPGLAMPVTLGVLVGAALGAKMLTMVDNRILRPIFVVVIVALGGQMIYRGLTGGFH